MQLFGDVCYNCSHVIEGDGKICSLLVLVCCPFLFVSAAVAVPQLQGTSVSFHIWPHLNLDTNLNSHNPAVFSYFVLLLLQWYQLLTRHGV